MVAEVGALVILGGIVAQIAQLVVSIRTRARHRDRSGDPWDGRTLEWSTASPPPAYNFAILPQVESLDAFWHAKQSGATTPPLRYRAIEMPANSPNGFVTALVAVVTGFALIWHIWWLAIAGLACALATLFAFGWRERKAREISAEQLAADDQARHSRGSHA